MKTKRCPLCESRKKLTKFYKNKSRKDGLQCYCIECQKYHCSIYYINNVKSFKKFNKKANNEREQT